MSAESIEYVAFITEICHLSLAFLLVVFPLRKVTRKCEVCPHRDKQGVL